MLLNVSEELNGDLFPLGEYDIEFEYRAFNG